MNAISYESAETIYSMFMHELVEYDEQGIPANKVFEAIVDTIACNPYGYTPDSIQLDAIWSLTLESMVAIRDIVNDDSLTADECEDFTEYLSDLIDLRRELLTRRH